MPVGAQVVDSKFFGQDYGLAGLLSKSSTLTSTLWARKIPVSNRSNLYSLQGSNSFLQIISPTPPSSSTLSNTITVALPSILNGVRMSQRRWPKSPLVTEITVTRTVGLGAKDDTAFFAEGRVDRRYFRFRVIRAKAATSHKCRPRCLLEPHRLQNSGNMLRPSDAGSRPDQHPVLRGKPIVLRQLLPMAYLLGSSSFSMSSMVGRLDFRFSGRARVSSNSETPISFCTSRRASCWLQC